jgi:predicted site-specific integrase-resolvase
MNGYWVPHREARDFYGVSDSTIRRWASTNKIVFKRTPSGQRTYFINDKTCSENKLSLENTILENYVYCRVSSNKQKDDLERQIQFLSSKYPGYKIIKDIGSGLNYKRPGLLKLLEQSSKGNINEIVVASKDRLCRFGFELIEWIFLQNHTKLVVLEHSDKTHEQKFTEDILAILQVFACRWNGQRKYSDKIKKNKITSNVFTKETVTEMESSPQVHI